MPSLLTSAGRAELSALYRDTLLSDVVPFWLRHGLDHAHGGIFTSLDRDGSVSSRAKGNLFKGPFHLPRMLWLGARLLA